MANAIGAISPCFALKFIPYVADCAKIYARSIIYSIEPIHCVFIHLQANNDMSLLVWNATTIVAALPARFHFNGRTPNGEHNES